MCSYDCLEDSGLPAGVAAGMVDSRERKGEELEKLEREFLGMVPGGGIMAVFLIGEEPFYTLDPVVCWVAEHIEDGIMPRYQLVGYGTTDFGLEAFGDIANLFTYMHESQITDEVRAEWRQKGIKNIVRGEEDGPETDG